MRLRLAIAGVLAAVSPSYAVPDPDVPPPPVEPEPATPEPGAPPTVAPVSLDTLERIDQLEARTHELERRAREANQTTADVSRMAWLSRYIGVFIDVGAFAVGGDGSGIRSDFLHVHYPQYKNTISGQWVFMGDPLATAINSLGEPADTGNSREHSNDTIDSGGRPSLIVNSLGLSIGRNITHQVSVAALAELLPRPGPDILDVELAHVEYIPSDAIDVRIQAGKIDSVLGVEYRTQDATKRLTVTPSLICRYTCGRPIGIAARYTSDTLSVHGSITDGDDFTELFQPETSIKSSSLPSVSGHVQWSFGDLELGTSAMIGPQDRQPALHVHHWHYGLDAKLRHLHGFTAVAEYVQGHQQGSTSGEAMELGHAPCDLAQCLTYKGAYLLVDRPIADWLHPYVRIDWRDAVLASGAQFVYESHEIRATIGAQAMFLAHTGGGIAAKLEYTSIRELEAPQFPHDVITSSLVVFTD